MSFKRSLYFVSLLAFVALGGACKTTDLTQTGIKPADAKAELQAGNQRYLKGEFSRILGSQRGLITLGSLASRRQSGSLRAQTRAPRRS